MTLFWGQSLGAARAVSPPLPLPLERQGQSVSLEIPEPWRGRVLGASGPSSSSYTEAVCVCVCISLLGHRAENDDFVGWGDVLPAAPAGPALRAWQLDLCGSLSFVFQILSCQRGESAAGLGTCPGGNSESSD